MPKVKRFRNSLKSVHASHDVNGNCSASTSPSQSNAIGPSTSPQSFPHDASYPMPCDEVQQEQTSTQPSNSSATSQSNSNWIVETIDMEKHIKTMKLKVHDVNNLPLGVRIIVDFDEYGAAIGAADGLLAGYCGTLATDCNLFPIGFDKWSGQSGVPQMYKKDCFEMILKPHFYFRTTEATAYRHCISRIWKKWATHRQRLYDEFNDPAKSTNEILANVPKGINKDQWASYVTYRKRPSTIERCEKNKEIRSKQKIPHTGGSKSLARRRHEIFLATGEKPSRGKMYLETHKRKGGSFVNEEARIIGEQIELSMAQSNESEASPNDIIGKLFGSEHPGRVRCLGMGAVPSNTFKNAKQRFSNLSVPSSDHGASSSINTYLHQKVSRLEYQLEGTLNALKAYMISKEGSIPDEFVSLFATQPQTSDIDADVDAEPTSPMDV